MQKTIKVNRNLLIEELEMLYRRAGTWSGSMGGESQLYGILNDEKDEIVDFEIHEFAGNNSWVQGEYHVHLATMQWFDPLDGENWDQWWDDEKNGNSTNETIQKYEKWEEFERNHPEEWKGILEEWRDIALHNYMSDWIYETLNRIEEFEDGYDTVKIEVY